MDNIESSVTQDVVIAPEVAQTETKRAKRNKENTEVAQTEAKSVKKPVTDAHRALLGEIILINNVTNQAKKLSSYNANILYENACLTHGGKNVRLFEVKEDNLEELVVILDKYKNDLIKKD